jgi:hypothetical protein
MGCAAFTVGVAILSTNTLGLGQEINRGILSKNHIQENGV